MTQPGGWGFIQGCKFEIAQEINTIPEHTQQRPNALYRKGWNMNAITWGEKKRKKGRQGSWILKLISTSRSRPNRIWCWYLSHSCCYWARPSHFDQAWNCGCWWTWCLFPNHNLRQNDTLIISSEGLTFHSSTAENFKKHDRCKLAQQAWMIFDLAHVS